AAPFSNNYSSMRIYLYLGPNPFRRQSLLSTFGSTCRTSLKAKKALDIQEPQRESDLKITHE
ncbi:hypothetical protein, partial [Pseudomonas viridiflava]|uniref:hypothetical protein n=1 Tax=Pseudomonas viridiflava TaxID=33069 RepID=UPI001981C14F